MAKLTKEQQKRLQEKMESAGEPKIKKKKKDNKDSDSNDKKNE